MTRSLAAAKLPRRNFNGTRGRRPKKGNLKWNPPLIAFKEKNWFIQISLSNTRFIKK